MYIRVSVFVKKNYVGINIFLGNKDSLINISGIWKVIVFTKIFFEYKLIISYWNKLYESYFIYLFS